MRGVAVVSKGLLLNPLTLWIGAFLILNTVLEKVIPGFNLLGATLSVLAAPIGFTWGLIKGVG